MPSLSQKEQEYTKAARLRFKEGMEHREIAHELGYKPQTIRRWFSEGKVEDMKRKFSDQEMYKLQRAIEQDIWDAETTAKELLSNAQKYAESSSDFRQAAEAHMKVRKKKIKLLQELGVIQKPKERKEHIEKGQSDDVLERMQEAYKELEEENTDEQD